MKKMYFVLFFVVGCAFLFFSCDVTGNLDSTVPDLVDIAKNNDQGEDNDDQGGKPKPPIVKPPVEDEETPPVIDQPKDDMEIQSISFQVGAISNSMGSRKNHELFKIIRTRDELDYVASERYYQYWTDAGGPFNVYYLENLTEKYDETFFLQNALILNLFVDGNTGGMFDVIQMQRQGNELTILNHWHSGMMTAISYWTVIIEVTQTDVSGIIALKNEYKCVCYISPKEDEKKPPVVDFDIENSAEVDNLLEKYNINMSVLKAQVRSMTLQPMPYISFSVDLKSIIELPLIEVSAIIMTKENDKPVFFYDIYDGRGKYGDLFHKDFRLVDFCLPLDDYTYIEVIVKILDEHQKFTLDYLDIKSTW